MNKKLKLEELGRLSVEEFKAAEKSKLSLFLDNIRSYHNVGSAFRIADAFRLQEVFLGGYTPCPPHKEIRKTALGASESVSWAKVEDEVEFLKDKKMQGIQIVCLEQTSNSLSLEKFKTSKQPVILIVGNEVEGVSQKIIDLADDCIEIPQFGTKHSLNVSVALGIATWKLIEAHLEP